MKSGSNRLEPIGSSVCHFRGSKWEPVPTGSVRVPKPNGSFHRSVKRTVWCAEPRFVSVWSNRSTGLTALDTAAGSALRSPARSGFVTTLARILHHLIHYRPLCFVLIDSTGGKQRPIRMCAKFNASAKLRLCLSVCGKILFRYTITFEGLQRTSQIDFMHL